MLMRVRERNDEVEIELRRLGGRHHVVLATLSGESLDGASPFDRAKLESLSVRARADAMNVRLRAKRGETLDVSELYRSLRRALFEKASPPLGGTLAG